MSNDKSEWRWYASSDGENYTVGPCLTREACIEEAKSCELGYEDIDDATSLRFFVVEGRRNPIDISSIFNISIILEEWDSTTGYDLAPDYDDCLSNDVSQEKWAILQEMITKTVRAWQEEHKAEIWPIVFSEIRSSERIYISLEA